MEAQLTYLQLKARQREIRDGFSEALGLRTHRALSWLQRAEQETDDGDACFIFLWISLNAAYANDLHDRKRFSERRVLVNFLKRLIESDADNLLGQIVWDEFPGSIRLLIDSKYVFQPFWECQYGRMGEVEWQREFHRSRISANKALGRMDTKKVLAVIFDRLYVLRNQLIHGGSTWNSKVNRAQIRDGVNIMMCLVPTIVHLMMENPTGLWGDPCYPVVK